MHEENEASGESLQKNDSTQNWTSTIESLIPNGRELVKVSPNAKVKEAITLMSCYNYSQLPVMTGYRDKNVKGAISWKSIGLASIANLRGDEVRQYMDTVRIVNGSDSIFEAAPYIAKYDYVLVKNKESRIIGIITASDLTEEFRCLHEPFFLSGMVELNLRHILQKATITECDLKRAAQNEKSETFPLANIEKLTLGQIYLLMAADEIWQKLSFKEIDQKEFRKALFKVTEIRNAVMHFRTKEPTEEQRNLLLNFSDLITKLTKAQS